MKRNGNISELTFNPQQCKLLNNMMPEKKLNIRNEAEESWMDKS